jgi:hypothetical protein
MQNVMGLLYYGTYNLALSKVMLFPGCECSTEAHLGLGRQYIEENFFYS